MARKAIQPVFGDEIEQGRDRDQVFRAVERRREIAAEIERNGIQPDIFAELSAARHRQQARVVVHEVPTSAVPEVWAKCADGGAGTAGEIDDAYGVDAI